MTVFSGISQARAAKAGAQAQADASDRAAQLQAEAAKAATDEAKRQFDLSREDLAPWRQQGVTALNRLGAASAGDMSGFYTSPDYNFTRSEGMRDIGNSFAARGGAFSGNALKALTQFNSNLASGQFGDWWNRNAGLAGVGQSATSQGAQLGAGTAANIAGINQTAAGNIGNALMAGSNARATGLNNAAAAYSNASKNAMQILGYFMGGKYG